MKKNLFALLLTAALALSLCACSAPAGDGSGAPNPDASPSDLVQTGPNAGMNTPNLPQPPAEGDDLTRAAFRTALERIYNEQTLPNGDLLEMTDFSDISKAEFAVFDIDLDGEEELIFTFSDTCMAEMATYIYAYDAETDRLVIELWEFPSLSFYNTGIVEALASHNHGPAGDALWPFILYQYEPIADDYRKVAVVDAWDSNLVGDTYDGKTFPKQADADGDGVVYYVMYDGYALEDPMDGPAFQDWYNSWFQGTEKIEIPYVHLTPANIQSVG